MASGTNFKIYDPVLQLIASGGGGGSIPPGSITGSQIAPGTVTGGPGGNLAPGTVTGGPGGNLAPGTVTDTELATGAAATNINNGPAGSINASQISGGPFLPLAGGTMTGSIVQPIAPVTDNDVTNKEYVDTFKYGSYLFKSTSPIFLNPNELAKAFSTGNSTIGPDVWVDPNISCNMNTNGVVTIINNLQYTCYFRLTFIACNLDDSMNSSGMVGCSFYDENASSSFGVAKTLKCLPLSVFNLVNETFVNQVTLVALKSINPGGQFMFSIELQNVGPNIVTIDSSPVTNTSHLIIDRVV